MARPRLPGVREASSLPADRSEIDWVRVDADVVEIASTLIGIDTTNPGDGSGPGERAAAEYVVSLLAEVGVSAEIVGPMPDRTSVLARIRGHDPTRPGLAVHGHLDVVPANAADWQVPPFSGAVIDGVLWGRGAVDMKGQVAMILAVVRGLIRAGVGCPRDLVLAFFADEEAGMMHGSRWVVDHHPEHFAGVTEAIGEVGGFSHCLGGGQRLYPIATAEKGIGWMRLVAEGRAGHGSMLNDENAVLRLATAVDRIGRAEFPIRVHDSVHALLATVADVAGEPFDPASPELTVALLGSLAPMVGASLRTTAQPTGLSAGYKVNVVPGQAQAEIDGRFLPGERAALLDRIDELLGSYVRREFICDDIAVEAPIDAEIMTTMTDAIRAFDPPAVIAPYLLSGGTDHKALSRLGINGYGFLPMRLPAELDFLRMFHGVDERVPVASLHFGVRVLAHFLRRA